MAEVRQTDPLVRQPERILEQPSLGVRFLQRQVGEDGARVTVLRPIHQGVGFVRLAAGTAKVIAVPALGNVLPRDGLGAVQDHGPEQAGLLQAVLVDVDLQNFTFLP